MIPLVILVGLSLYATWQIYLAWTTGVVGVKGFIAERSKDAVTFRWMLAIWAVVAAACWIIAAFVIYRSFV